MTIQYQATGDEFLVNTNTSGNQSLSQLFALPSGDFLDVWYDRATDPSASGHYRAQRYHADGAAVGAEIAFNPPSGSMEAGQSAVGEDGRLYVTWRDATGTYPSFTSSILLQAMSTNGQRIGTPTTVASEAYNSNNGQGALGQQITSLANGGFVIAWVSHSGTAQAGLSFQLVDAAGHLTGQVHDLVEATPNQSGQPAISALHEGGFVMSWDDGTLLKGQKFDATGAAVGSTFVVNPGNDDHRQTDFHIVELNDGRMVATWIDFDSYFSFPNNYYATYGLNAQLLDVNGKPTGAKVKLDGNTADNLTVTELSSGGFIAVWQVNGDIKAQMFDAAGAKAGTTFTVNTVTAETQSAPSVTSLASGGFVISWTDNSHQGGDSDGSAVKARIFEIAPLIGTASADTLVGSSYGDVLQGLGGNDVLAGLAGDDHLSGGDGDDRLDGGDGKDVLDGGAGVDTASYASATAAATVNLALTAAQNTVGAGIDQLIGIENLTGSAFNDKLTGDAGANRIEGGAGNDVLDGGAGIDTLSYESASAGVTISLAVTAQQDTIGAGSDTIKGFENLLGSAYADHLTGNAGANVIEGGAGDDMIEGGAGDDQLYGGAGIDTASYATATAAVIASLASGSASGGAGNDMLVGFENLIGSGYDDLLTGDAGANSLSGGNGNDTLIGGLGNDLLDGGAGIDTASYATATAAITASLVSGSATGGAGSDTLVGIENLIGSGYNDVLTGDAGANSLWGGDGNDMLVGGLGNDLLDGGAGIDTVSYAAAVAAITANLASGSASGGAGNDTLIGIENLTGSAYDDVLTGDSGANTLMGGNGNDVLNGGAGNDLIDGGNGIDTVSYADALAGITLNLVGTSYQNTGGAGIDIVHNVENVTGSAFNDTLTGNQFANILSGGAGDDLLSGGLGNDTLYGGDGIDTASYATATGAVRVSLAIATAQSTISAGSDILSGIENLTGSAYDDQLTGDAGNNVLTGNAGNDTLVGGLGNDTLSGGAGIDTASYANATAGVTISLLLTTAQDTHGAGMDTLVSIENIVGSAYDDVITGSAQVNVITGGNGNDTIDAGSSNDTVDGGYGNDILKGAAGDDTLLGNVGTDTLTGGAGADTLTGGTQNDRFVYTALTDSTVAASDRITDFAKGDILDVSAIDANSKVAGNQAFVHADAFTHTAGEFTLTYDAGTNTTTALFDTNGDANADMAILFTGNVTALTSTWLL